MNNSNNNSKGNKSRVAAFFTGKGFYIALILCLAAIGVSGYLILRSNVTGSIEEPETVAAASIPSAEVITVIDEDADTILETDSVPVMAIPSVSEDELAEMAAEAAASAADDIVIWPIAGEAIKPYSVDALVYSVTMSDWRVHSGVDISAPLGTEVMAAAAGTVAEVFSDDYLGATIVIYHGDAVTTKYSNLTSVPTVAPGDTVAAGDIIGAVGQTSMSESADPPHLHLEVYKEGVAIDPVEYLG